MQPNLTPPIAGVWAALLCPRDPAGEVDHLSLARLAQTLEAAGLDGLVLNGATGEYASATLAEVAASLETVQGATKLPVILGVGAADVRQSLRLAQLGSPAALLAPVPHFFRYGPGDAVTYIEALAAQAPVPILLYHLPQFSSGYGAEAVAAILEKIPQVMGIKDSSGSLELLRSLRREHPTFRRILGHDGALVEAVQEGLLDALISGVAGVAPELILKVWRGEGSAELAELLTHLEGVPTPWGLKWIAEARGWFPATYALPLSEARQREAAEFQAWCRGWLKRI